VVIAVTAESDDENEATKPTVAEPLLPSTDTKIQEVESTGIQDSEQNTPQPRGSRRKRPVVETTSDSENFESERRDKDSRKTIRNGKTWPKNCRGVLYHSAEFHKMQVRTFYGVLMAYDMTLPPLDALDTKNGDSLYDVSETRDDETVTGGCMYTYATDGLPAVFACFGNHCKLFLSLVSISTY
jgi:hypothetical protein